VSELWRGEHLYIYVTITSKLAAVLCWLSWERRWSLA